MHIPDGYLGPKTCAVFYAAMAPVWYSASRRLERSMKVGELPLLALSASFVFVIMMFNIPIPGGSTGHMVGSSVVAIVLGPWAATFAVSLALTLQAFIFADGGVTALGANCFNMAFLMSFSSYYVYRAVVGSSPSAGRRIAASAAAGYVSVNIAAFAVGLELGVQPLIASGPEGLPLYSPYPLAVALPAMVVPHLLFFGPIEALGTSLIVGYVGRTSGELLRGAEKGIRPLWAALLVLLLLTPLGLFAGGTPWGEWGVSELKDLVGFVPRGMERLNELWRGVLPDYTVPGAEGPLGSTAAYVLSAVAGSLLTVFIVYLWGRRWPRG